MKVGEMLDLLIIKLGGGRLTSDTSVRREDLSVYLAPAVNYALLKQYYVTKNEEGVSDFPEDFVATFTDVPVQFDSDRDLSYVDLPGEILSMSNNRGLRNVSAMKGADTFIQISLNDRSQVAYYPNTFAGYTLFWLEGQRIYFQNIATDKVLVRMIQSVNELDYEAELPIPAGYEVEVMKLMEEFFTGQRQLPFDNKPDNNKPNA